MIDKSYDPCDPMWVDGDVVWTRQIMMDGLSSRTVPFGMNRSAIGLFFSFLFFLFIFLAIRLLSYPKNNEKYVTHFL